MPDRTAVRLDLIGSGGDRNTHTEAHRRLDDIEVGAIRRADAVRWTFEAGVSGARSPGAAYVSATGNRWAAP